jgi:hypothetical protein
MVNRGGGGIKKERREGRKGRKDKEKREREPAPDIFKQINI